MIEDAFGGLDPRMAQKGMHVERYAELLGKLKPAFIHHPESKRHLKKILEDLGCADVLLSKNRISSRTGLESIVRFGRSSRINVAHRFQPKWLLSSLLGLRP